MTTETEELVLKIAEDEGLALYKALKGKKDFSEFKLAEKLDRDINITRRILYSLHAHNLATFIKKKDQKKGWYIYYWTFSESEASRLVAKYKKNPEIKKERTNTYFCNNKCGIVDFEEAFDTNFKCGECGEVLEQN